MASVCRSLQCLISTLTQVGRRGLLFRFAGSVVLRGGRCRQMSLACVGSTRLCGEHAQCSGHTGSAPLTGVCFPRLHCSGSRLLYREWALSCVHFPGLSCSDSGFRVLHKGAGSVGPAFCAFPSRNSSGSQELDGHTLPGCSAPYPLRGPSLSFLTHRCGAPCVPSGKLISGCDPPSRC